MAFALFCTTKSFEYDGFGSVWFFSGNPGNVPEQNLNPSSSLGIARRKRRKNFLKNNNNKQIESKMKMLNFFIFVYINIKNWGF